MPIAPLAAPPARLHLVTPERGVAAATLSPLARRRAAARVGVPVPARPALPEPATPGLASRRPPPALTRASRLAVARSPSGPSETGGTEAHARAHADVRDRDLGEAIHRLLAACERGPALAPEVLARLCRDIDECAIQLSACIHGWPDPTAQAAQAAQDLHAAADPAAVLARARALSESLHWRLTRLLPRLRTLVALDAAFRTHAGDAYAASAALEMARGSLAAAVRCSDRRLARVDALCARLGASHGGANGEREASSGHRRPA